MKFSDMGLNHQNSAAIWGCQPSDYNPNGTPPHPPKKSQTHSIKSSNLFDNSHYHKHKLKT